MRRDFLKDIIIQSVYNYNISMHTHSHIFYLCEDFHRNNVLAS